MVQLVVVASVLAGIIAMTNVSKSAKFFVKSVLYGLSISGCALYGVIALIFLRLIGKPEYAQYTTARAFYYVVSILFRIKIKVKNEEYLRQHPAIYISNHQSALDVFMLGRIFQPGMSVTAKSSLKFVPFLGWFMMLSGTFFLNRQKSEKARKVLSSALGQLKTQKRGLFVFPEGTRSGYETLDMLPFKKGAFHLAKEAGIPIVPIVVSNTTPIFCLKTKTFNSGLIEIEVLPPVPTSDVKSNDQVNELCTGVRESMIKKLKSDVGYSTSPLGAFKRPAEYAAEGMTGTESHDTVSEQTPLINRG